MVFIDNVRVLLILLVIAFHAGAPYAGVYWYDIPFEMTLLSEFTLAWFLTVCLAFFLSLFFMIAGYFTPGSYDRKGGIRFLKDRIVRLGVPLTFFFFVVMPVFTYVLYWLGSQDHLSLWEFLVSEYHWETHHLWFIENLLVFTGLYWVWRLLLPVKVKKNLKVPGNVGIFLFAVLLAVVTFTVRIWYPSGWWDPLKLVEPAYLPQFASFFIIGVISYQNDWFNRMPTSVGMTWLRIGIFAALLFPVVYVVGEGQFTLLAGGFHWQPFVFAVWEALVCCGLCCGLVVFFREKLNKQGNIGKVLSTNVYTVYLVHILVVVSLQYALVGVRLYPLGKFALVVLVGVVLSFLFSHYIVRRLPFVKRIL